MRRGNWPRAIVLTLLLLALLLTGCECNSPLSRPAPGPLIPPLPAEARPPARPPECLPSCLSGLTEEREYWLQQLTKVMPPQSRANEPMTR